MSHPDEIQNIIIIYYEGIFFNNSILLIMTTEMIVRLLNLQVCFKYVLKYVYS